MKKNNYLTIKEFSTLTHTPIDTLKHYDRIDLLKPAYIGENNYRYYLPEQAFLLTLAGLILVLTWVIPYIYDLFESVQTLFTIS